jgi:hypothetical protein
MPARICLFTLHLLAYSWGRTEQRLSPFINMRLHSRPLSVIAALLVALWTAVAHAHPGHGTTNPDSPTHLLEPVHFVTLLAAVCFVGMIACFMLHRRRKLAKATAASRGRMFRRDDA